MQVGCVNRNMTSEYRFIRCSHTLLKLFFILLRLYQINRISLEIFSEFRGYHMGFLHWFLRNPFFLGFFRHFFLEFFQRFPLRLLWEGLLQDSTSSTFWNSVRKSSRDFLRDFIQDFPGIRFEIPSGTFSGIPTRISLWFFLDFSRDFFYDSLTNYFRDLLFQHYHEIPSEISSRIITRFSFLVSHAIYLSI